MPKFVDNLRWVGGPHPTGGLAGYPARDYIAPAGSIVRAPFTGTVRRLSGSNTWGGGFGGRSIYLRDEKGETFKTHFAGDLLVKVGDRVTVGQAIGRVGRPTSGMTPHIHMGYTGGDPLFTLADSDGDLLRYEKPKPKPKPPELATATLRKVDHEGCVACAGHDGHWQVVIDYPGKRPDHVLAQTTYREAVRIRDNERRIIRLTADPSWPKPLPGWWWAWAQWVLGEGDYADQGPKAKGRRPRKAPKRIPKWAWDRLELLRRLRRRP